MSIYRLAARAKADLLAAFLNGIEWFGPVQAEFYQAELERCFLLMAENPRMGRLVETIRPGVRRHVHKSHAIYMKLTRRAL